LEWVDEISLGLQWVEFGLHPQPTRLNVWHTIGIQIFSVKSEIDLGKYGTFNIIDIFKLDMGLKLDSINLCDYV
jgi:hypothetical protein